MSKRSEKLKCQNIWCTLDFHTHPKYDSSGIRVPVRCPRCGYNSDSPGYMFRFDNPVQMERERVAKDDQLDRWLENGGADIIRKASTITKNECGFVVKQEILDQLPA